MERTKLLLIFGGQSSEHDISLLSANGIYNSLDSSKYEASLIKITADGRWLSVDSIESSIGTKVQIDISNRQFTLSDGATITPDVVFPILHGQNGEDGAIQGLLKMMNVPFVGPGTLGAALTMDKDTTKRVLRDTSIPVAKWITWHVEDTPPAYEEAVDALGDVLFVKPANEGSSYGVSKVRSATEFSQALQDAAKYDSIILIEEAIAGFEVQVSMLGNDNPEISQICEIESVTDFHDFEDKYSENSSVIFHIPARLPVEQTERIKQYATKAYQLTRGQGMARIDFFVSNDSVEYLNEINSIPGFTNVSVYPMLWKKQGIEYAQLVDKLIQLALE